MWILFHNRLHSQCPAADPDLSAQPGEIGDKTSSSTGWDRSSPGGRIMKV